MNKRANKDMLYTLLNQLWRVVAGPALLLSIPIFLTAVEQGYWYTFTSIAALSVFADLGFSTIILQFTAHEFAKLNFADDGKVDGDEESLWRLASFLRFCLGWLRKSIGIVFPIIAIGGWWFLSRNAGNVSWHGAWVLYSVASALTFFNAALMSFFEGCNSVAKVQTIRMFIVIVNTSMMLLGLVLNAGLWALTMGMSISSLVGSALLWLRFYKAFVQLMSISKGECYNWWPEFSNLIWQYAISWGSGYFIFQLFVPLAFMSFGAEYAGMVGMSIAAWTAGFNVSFSWITAVTPRLNMLIELQRWRELDCLFKRRCLAVLATMMLGGAVYGIMWYVFCGHTIFHRLLPPLEMFVLFVCWLCQSWVNALAVYLRGHKQEPLMKLSAVSAVYVAVSTYICAVYLPREWLFIGFASSYVWGMPIVYRIFQKCRKEHALNDECV